MIRVRLPGSMGTYRSKPYFDLGSVDVHTCKSLHCILGFGHRGELENTVRVGRRRDTFSRRNSPSAWVVAVNIGKGDGVAAEATVILEILCEGRKASTLGPSKIARIHRIAPIRKPEKGERIAPRFDRCCAPVGPRIKATGETATF
jgi:hypothetical protein